MGRQRLRGRPDTGVGRGKVARVEKKDLVKTAGPKVITKGTARKIGTLANSPK